MPDACAYCGKPIDCRAPDGRRTKRKYCSAACNTQAYLARHPEARERGNARRREAFQREWAKVRDGTETPAERQARCAKKRAVYARRVAGMSDERLERLRDQWRTLWRRLADSNPEYLTRQRIVTREWKRRQNAAALNDGAALAAATIANRSHK